MTEATQNDNRWWALAMRPDRTQQSLDFLTNRLEVEGVEIFNPTRLILEYSKGGFHLSRRPLYPGYAFIQCDEPALEKVNKCRSKCFYGPVRIGDELIPVRADEIAQIKEITNEEGTAGISYGLLRDGRVEITSGPLKGKEGVIVKLSKRKHRASILVSLGNKQVKLELACIVQE